MSVSTEAVALDIANIPAELIDYRQWVCWRWEVRDEKRTKVPVTVTDEAAFCKSDPSLLRRASSIEASTWLSFPHATAALINGSLAGIGFVVTAEDPFCGVDLDHCRVENGWADWAIELVERLNSYTEVTPSGDGLRVWLRANLAEGDSRRRKGQAEMYDRGRFFTITGRRLHDLPATIEAYP
jgi:primase-polymerase (primpol)-like protein